MIKKNHDLSVRRQCQLLGINRSSLYYQERPQNTTYQALQEDLMKQIDKIHTQFPYMGSRKIVIKLKENGYNICRKTVRRLIQKMGIYAIYPKPNLSKRNSKEAVVPYLLRNYDARFPNQVWSIDITYLPMNRSHMCLTAIIDWHSRKIVGHYLSDTLDASSVILAVKEAISQHGVPAIINSDQGSQFTSLEYKNVLKAFGIRQSMDGKSRWADNIMIERWFRSLKTELIYPNEFSSPRDLRKRISEYVTEYNTLRPHAALDYVTPDAVYYSHFSQSLTEVA